MSLEIIEADAQYESVFRNLFQFYIYEFSRYMGWAVTQEGRFQEDDLEGCWTQDDRYPFLFRYDGKWIGLAIVDENIPGYLVDEPRTYGMSEFFIMGAYQRRGYGTRAAEVLFKRFPGTWEVFQLTKNVNAQFFWREIITEITGGQYREIRPKNRDGIVQVFTISADQSTLKQEE